MCSCFTNTKFIGNRGCNFFPVKEINKFSWDFPASRGLSWRGKNERKERDRSLSFLSFLPRRERPLLAGKLGMCKNKKTKAKKKTTKFVFELAAFRVRLPYKRRFAPVVCGVLASSSWEIELNWVCWKSIDNWDWNTYTGPLYRRERFICLNLSIPVWNSVTIVVVRWANIYSWNNSKGSART